MIKVGTFITTEKIRKNVNDVLDRGQLSYGYYSETLEEKFAEMHGGRYGILSNSGTSSLQVALHAIKKLYNIPDGSLVAVPAVTFVATVNVVYANNLRPVLVDVSETSYNMNPVQLERCLQKNDVRVIMPVHLFGQMANMTAISRIANGIPIIQDSCETVLAKHGRKKIGEFGDIACFSMYVAHHLVAGVGGIAITSNQDQAAMMRSLVNHGRDGIFFEENTGKEVMRGRFRFLEQGYSYRITELEAAVGVAQLEMLPRNVVLRQYNAEYLTDGLMDLSDHFRLPTVDIGNTHSWMMYPIICEPHINKWEVCAFLEERGIETREMLPLTNQPVYNGLFNEADYPVAQWINNKGFYIGCHADLNIKDLDCIIEAMYDYIEKK